MKRGSALKIGLYSLLRRIGTKMGHPPFLENRFHRPILTPSETNEYIKRQLENGQPFMAARFGHGEFECTTAYLDIQRGRKATFGKKMAMAFQGDMLAWSENIRKVMHVNAGFFPATEPMLDRFATRMLQDIPQVDLMGIWGELRGEAALYQQFCPKAELTALSNLEPYYHASPWSGALKGKKVLVIHPFTESIALNFKYREHLFPEPVLPDFELKTLKSVQSIAGNSTSFSDWFEALDAMVERIGQIEFDVAIIGAGAYGLPLAAEVKRRGKQAIHLGGATQILFGIKGKRWDGFEPVNRFYNAYWARPLPSEIPDGYNEIENGCYW